MDAFGQFEGYGIELEGGDVGEGVLVGIEELVVVDGVVLAEDPLAVRAQVSLRGLALDFVAQRFLALVGLGDVELIEEVKAGADGGGDDEDGEDDAVDAGPGGLHRGDFVGLLQQAEGGEDGQQNAERRHDVDHRRRDVEQILAHHNHRNAVAEDVSEKFEEGKDQGEQQERKQDHGEIHGEVAQDQLVEDERVAGSAVFFRGSGAVGMADGGDALASAVDEKAVANPTVERVPCGAKRAEIDERILDAADQEEAGGEENKVGRPDTGCGWNASAAAERDSGEGDEVVEKDEGDGEHEAHALASLFGGKAERNADQGENQAGGRQGKPAVELDEIPAGTGGRRVLGIARLAGVGFGMVAAVPELAGGHFGNGDELGLGLLGFGESDGQIGLREG